MQVLLDHQIRQLRDRMSAAIMGMLCSQIPRRAHILARPPSHLNRNFPKTAPFEQFKDVLLLATSALALEMVSR